MDKFDDKKNININSFLKEDISRIVEIAIAKVEQKAIKVSEQRAKEIAQIEATKIVYKETSALGMQFNKSFKDFTTLGFGVTMVINLINLVSIVKSSERGLTFLEILSITWSIAFFVLIAGLIGYYIIMRINADYINKIRP